MPFIKSRIHDPQCDIRQEIQSVVLAVLPCLARADTLMPPAVCHIAAPAVVCLQTLGGQHPFARIVIHHFQFHALEDICVLLLKRPRVCLQLFSADRIYICRTGISVQGRQCPAREFHLHHIQGAQVARHFAMQIVLYELLAAGKGGPRPEIQVEQVRYLIDIAALVILSEFHGLCLSSQFLVDRSFRLDIPDLFVDRSFRLDAVRVF